MWMHNSFLDWNCGQVHDWREPRQTLNLVIETESLLGLIMKAVGPGSCSTKNDDDLTCSIRWMMVSGHFLLQPISRDISKWARRGKDERDMYKMLDGPWWGARSWMTGKSYFFLTRSYLIWKWRRISAELLIGFETRSNCSPNTFYRKYMLSQSTALNSLGIDLFQVIGEGGNAR